MKKKSLKQAVWSTLAIALVGCNSVTSNKGDNYAEAQLYHSEKPIVEVETIDDTVYGRYSNQDFALEYNDNGLISLVTTKDKEVNIANFCAFAYEVYNEKLRPKLNNKEELYQQDIELLAFCIATQIDTINAISNTILTATVGGSTVITPSAINTIQVADFNADFKKQYNDIYKKSINNFQHDGNITYKNIEKWGESFRNIPSDDLHELFCELSEYNKTIIGQDVDNKGNMIKTSIALWGAGGLASSLILTGGSVYYYYMSGSNTFDQYQYTKSPKEISLLWKRVNNDCTIYVKDLIRIYNDLNKYIDYSISSSSRKLAKEIHGDMYTAIEDAIRGYYLVSYDLPFTIQCCLAYSAIEEAKGFFNDDEDEMINIIIRFNDYVSGVEMLKNLKTPYAASCYTELLAKVKGELSKNDFETLKTTIKLYQVNVSDEFCNDNTIDKL